MGDRVIKMQGDHGGGRTGWLGGWEAAHNSRTSDGSDEKTAFFILKFDP